MMHILRAAATAALAGALLLTVPGSSQAVADDAPVPASSSGLGVFARLGDLDVAEAYAAYPEGPARITVETVELDDLGTVQQVTATASGDDERGRSAAEAGVESARLGIGDMALRTGHIRAGCSTGLGAAPVGAVSLGDVVLGVPSGTDMTFAETPAPNTTLLLPDGLGRVVLNEQIAEDDGSLTVNAFHLTLAEGELTLGSANCGTRTGIATLTGVAHEADDGTADSGAAPAGVAGVRFEVVDEAGLVLGSCATGAAGRCGVDFVPRDDMDAYVCVADVPDGYVMPDADAVCSGPYRVAAGEEVVMGHPSELERDAG
ncbi:choice-of-anchor P family protein [Streptomyces specialis]|uniref:choice-of-anchor P family protein n=1 Tax=Streptomyces specialis TaxID=498367 RepID=UPI00073F0E48|nr:choice-of-anchor P family protein [Streptomyces specialis]